MGNISAKNIKIYSCLSKL